MISPFRLARLFVLSSGFNGCTFSVHWSFPSLWRWHFIIPIEATWFLAPKASTRLVRPLIVILQLVFHPIRYTFNRSYRPFSLNVKLTTICGNEKYTCVCGTAYVFFQPKKILKSSVFITKKKNQKLTTCILKQNFLKIFNIWLLTSPLGIY